MGPDPDEMNMYMKYIYVHEVHTSLQPDDMLLKWETDEVMIRMTLKSFY